MIITRSPLRISLGGGGTDLPSYYQEHTGFLIAAAIDKYVYITLHQTFVPEGILKYSKLERVADVDAIEHPIIREALRLADVDVRALELSSMADIPAGTGLGSSGSFTTAILLALHAHKKSPHPSGRAGRAGLHDRTGHPQRADRQTGPVHRGLRRDHLLPVPARRQGAGVAAQDQRGNPLQPRGQSPVVLHGLLAFRFENPQGTGRQEQGRRTRAW